MSDERSAHPGGPTAAAPYRYAEQMKPPASRAVSEVARATFEHVLEVDPRLMQEHVLQQTFPNWDTLRLMRSRRDHLEWMHRHFASAVIAGSQIIAQIESDSDSPNRR